MSKQVYIETTIPSYLVARPSRDIVIAAHQRLTHDWWDHNRSRFELVTSQFTIDESSAGDQEMARKRLEALTDIPLLEATHEVTEIAQAIIDRKALPEKAALDALHIAVATTHRIAYLLTWNCKHIANAEIQKAVVRICQEMGFEMPIICTPEELMGD